MEDLVHQVGRWNEPHGNCAEVRVTCRYVPRVRLQLVETAGTAGTAGGPFLTSEMTRGQGGQLGQRIRMPGQVPRNLSEHPGRYGWSCIDWDIEGHRRFFFYFLETLENAVHADHPVPDSFL
jgi:hypothetical protein